MCECTFWAEKNNCRMNCANLLYNSFTHGKDEQVEVEFCYKDRKQTACVSTKSDKGVSTESDVLKKARTAFGLDVDISLEKKDADNKIWIETGDIFQPEDGDCYRVIKAEVHPYVCTYLPLSGHLVLWPCLDK